MVPISVVVSIQAITLDAGVKKPKCHASVLLSFHPLPVRSPPRVILIPWRSAEAPW